MLPVHTRWGEPHAKHDKTDIQNSGTWLTTVYTFENDLRMNLLPKTFGYVEKENKKLQKKWWITNGRVISTVKADTHMQTKWFKNGSQSKCTYVWTGLRICAQTQRELGAPGVLCLPQVCRKLIYHMPSANCWAHYTLFANHNETWTKRKFCQKVVSSRNKMKTMLHTIRWSSKVSHHPLISSVRAKNPFEFVMETVAWRNKAKDELRFAKHYESPSTHYSYCIQ